MNKLTNINGERKRKVVTKIISNDFVTWVPCGPLFRPRQRRIRNQQLLCFKLTSEKYLLIGTRFFIGIVHMPPSIYIPVWIDQFGVQKWKTMFMTMVQVVIPTGKVAWYLLHALFGEENWQMGFVFEGAYLFLVGLFVSFTPGKYFSS